MTVSPPPLRAGAPPVIVTRPSPDAEDFAATLAMRGLASLHCPVIDITFYDAPLDAGALDGVGALAFTSANGVRAFAKRSARRDLPAFAVGPTTASAARAVGFTNTETAGGDVAALAETLVAAGARGLFTGVVLHVAGADRRGELADLAAERGVKTRRIVLYEARAVERLSDGTRRLLSNGEAAVATFFSPRSAHLFCAQLIDADLASAAPRLHAVSISDAAAAAVEAHNLEWADSVAADTATAQGVLMAVERVIDAICA